MRVENFKQNFEQYLSFYKTQSKRDCVIPNHGYLLDLKKDYLQIIDSAFK